MTVDNTLTDMEDVGTRETRSALYDAATERDLVTSAGTAFARSLLANGTNPDAPFDNRVTGRESTEQRLIKPESAGDALIAIRETQEARTLEAFLGLSLTAVARPDRSIESPRGVPLGNTALDPYLCSVFSRLDQGQRLEVRHQTAGNLDAKISFTTMVMAYCRSEIFESAVEELRALDTDLRYALSLAGRDYMFAPVVSANELNRPDSAWEVHIEAEGIGVLTSRPNSIGYTARRELLPSTVHLPYPTLLGRTTLDTVVAGMTSCPSLVEVVLTISPITLSRKQAERLSAARDVIRMGEPANLMFDGLQGARYVPGPDTLDVLGHWIEPWLRNPVGYRLDCVIRSAVPVPRPLLDALAAEIFQGNPTRISARKFADDSASSPLIEPQDEPALDLRNAFHMNHTLPPLFPDSRSLAEIGFKLFYRPPPFELPCSGLLLGAVPGRTTTREVRFEKADRSRHCYILGATGTGKSTLLYNMIMQDVENGEGVAVIDPHGDLYQQVLDSIPSRRAEDVVLIDPCDVVYATGLNFLECKGAYREMQKNFLINEMMKIFERMYDMRQCGGPIFEQYMRNGLALVMSHPDGEGTLVELPLLFEDSGYRNYLKAHCTDPYALGFWTGIAERASGDAALANMGPYITSKLNQFTHNQMLRPIIGQTSSTVDLPDIMNRGQILLVNLAKGLLGELDTELLGMLLMGKLFSAALSRAKLPTEQRRPFYLYVDEFQNFTTDSVAALLAEARKYGLCLTLANQTMAQLSANHGKQNLCDAVMGNVGTKLFFRLGANDSKDIGNQMNPDLSPQQLIELPDYQVACRILSRSGPIRPFVFTTIDDRNAPSLATTAATSNAIRARSNNRYARPVREVEAEILRRRTAWRNV